MQTISEELKAKYTDDNSHHIYYHIEVYYVMDMGNNEPVLTIENDRLVENSVEFKEGISGGGNLELGSIYTSSFIFNAADISTTLSGKYIRVYQTVDDSTEEMPIGRFVITAVDKTSDRRIKTVTAYDYSCFFDEDGAEILAKIKDCETVKDALLIISNHYGLEWEDLTFTGADYALSWNYDSVKDDTILVRDIMAMFGEILGGWIKINRQGKLFLKRITKPLMSEMEQLDYFRSNPSFDETETGLVEDVVYTDVDDTVYSATGNSGASIDLTGNFFLIGSTETIIKAFLTLAYNSVNTIQYYPVECNLDARPYLECGDFVRFTDNGTAYYTLIKERILTGIQALVDDYTCGSVNSSKEAYYMTSSNRQNPVVDAVRKANNRIEKARQEFAESLANASGMYETRVKQEDGSEILYQHNKPLLEDSTNIIKVTSEAIGFSTDGGDTYPFGLMINGEIIANLLYANGIDASYIIAESITADKIDLTDLFSKNITATNFNITGGSVNITTASESTSLINLNSGNYSCSLAPYSISLHNGGTKFFEINPGNFRTRVGAFLIYDNADDLQFQITNSNILIGSQSDSDSKTHILSPQTDIYGDIELKKDVKCPLGTLASSGMVGANGTSGYIFAAKIEITGAYRDCEIIINIMQRNGYSGDIIIKLTNVSSVSNYSLDYAYQIGNLTNSYLYCYYSEDDNKYIIELYLAKSGSYDHITIMDVKIPNYIRGYINISYPGTLGTANQSWKKITKLGSLVGAEQISSVSGTVTANTSNSIAFANPGNPSSATYTKMCQRAILVLRTSAYSGTGQPIMPTTALIDFSVGTSITKTLLGYIGTTSQYNGAVYYSVSASGDITIDIAQASSGASYPIIYNLVWLP